MKTTTNNLLKLLSIIENPKLKVLVELAFYSNGLCGDMNAALKMYQENIHMEKEVLYSQEDYEK